MTNALQLLVLTTAAWLNRQQEDVIDYLREECLENATCGFSSASTSSTTTGRETTRVSATSCYRGMLLRLIRMLRYDGANESADS